VGFRWATRDEAARLGLTGWVRNLPDGRVEAWIEGEPEAIAEMAEWLAVGPLGSRVRGIEVEDVAPSGLEGFRIRH
jgi:acylphosphatase